jgi:APA family basic amino acid/polyamine antiporter
MEKSSRNELKRVLGPWTAAAIVVGTVIGSGIFRVPQAMVQRVGTPEMTFVVWIFGGLLSLAGALTYAELAAAMPEAGGEYNYLREAYGPMWGFLYSWTQMWVAKSGSIASLAAAFIDYLSKFFPALNVAFGHIPLPLGEHGGPLEFRYGQLVAMALILALALVNYFGAKIGGNVQLSVTVIKVAALAAIIAAGLIFGSGAPADVGAAAPPLTTAGFFAALVAALWAYDGWNNVSMVSSEVKDPQKNLPRALVWGTAGVISIYLLANLAYFHVLSAGEVANSPRVAATMMGRLFGEAGASTVTIAVLISIFAALNGSLLSGSRVPYAAARDGYFFRSVARVHPEHRTPSVSLLWLGVWAALLVLSGKYEQLFTYVIFASWILYGMTTAAVIVLRKKRPDLHRPYKTIGYPFVPAIFVAVTFVFILSTLMDSPRESIMGIFLISLGLPFYFYWRKRAAGASGQSTSPND